MQIAGFDHIVLTVRDVAATADFYARAVNACVVDEGAGRIAIHFGEQKINLHEAGNERAPHAARPGTGTADFCLVTSSSADAIREHLTNVAITIALGPVVRNGGRGTMTSFYFRDPDGNLVEVSTYGSPPA